MEHVKYFLHCCGRTPGVPWRRDVGATGVDVKDQSLPRAMNRKLTPDLTHAVAR